MSSPVSRRPMHSEAVGRWGERFARAVRLGIAAAAVLIFTVLPIRAQTENVLYTFTGAATSGPDGANPGANLLRDASGNLYGTTQFGGTTKSGGTSGNGTVFELVYSNGSYTEKVLYSFGGATVNDGALPLGGLVMDSGGNLYGTTSEGGAASGGIVFELVSLNGSYLEKVLHSFLGELNGDGAGPQAGLVMDSHGNLFGTTVLGGNSNNGTVFEMVNSSGNYTETTLYDFKAGDDGGLPYAGLTVDSSGNLYGTTSLGGASNSGTVFEMVNSSGNYTETVLYSFSGGADGRGPIAAVIADSSGNLYGSTQFGGSSTACGTKLGCGVVFELAFASGSYTQHVLHTFMGLSGGDGGTPLGLVMDSSGNLYGVTEVGGSSDTSNTCAYGCGTVFELVYSPASPPSTSGSYTETVLYTFPTFSGDGLVPDAALVLDSSNHLYGITSTGGFTTPSGGGVMTACPFGCGIVFEFTPGAAAPTYMFTATIGSDQSANVGSAFAVPLEVTVQDASGKAPASPVTVTFAISPAAGGASGTFGNGTLTTTATTSTSTGIATASALTANSVAGTFTVEATAPSVTGTASFSLTNLTVQTQTATTTTFTTSSTFGTQNLPSGVAFVGNPVTVSVTVKPASGSSAPTGSALITDGGLGDTCTVSLIPQSSGTGKCTLTIATFPVGGITSLSAAYTSNSNAFLSSNSFAVTEQVVEGLVPCGAAITPLSVKQGSTVTETFTVCLAGNLNLGAVPVAVNVLECPKDSDCTDTVSSLGSGQYSVSVKLVTHSTAWLSVPRLRRGPGPTPWPLMLIVFGTLLALLMTLRLTRQSRASPRLLCARGLLFALMLSSMSACSGAPSQNLTPLGSYVLEINVVGGTFTATVPLNVTVTK